MKQVRTAIIGTGSIAFSSHIPAVMSIPNAKLVALCDINEETAKKFASKFGVEARTFEQIIKSKDIDSVIICTPTNVHCEQVLQALKHGKHVLCEKPLSVTLSDAKKMADAAKKSRKKTMLGFDERFNPYNKKIKELVENKVLGDCESFDFTFILPPKGGWRLDPEKSGGGPMWDSGPHKIDILRTLFGEPKSIKGKFESRFLEKEEDWAEILFKFKNTEGKLTVGIDKDADRLKEKFTLKMTDGVIEKTTESIRMDEHIKLNVQKNDSIIREPVEMSVDKYSRLKMFIEMHQHFVNCILDDKSPIISFNDGYENIRILNIAKNSK